MTKRGFLSNNAIKIIACFLMLVDHSVIMLFPSLRALRYFTRPGFALFAFMLAEGCFYTKNKLKHFLLPTVFGILMQIVFYVFTGDTDFSIFLIFSFSIVLSYLFGDALDSLKGGNKLRSVIGFSLFVLLAGVVFVFDSSAPYLKANYGFYGVMLPVLFYISKRLLPQNIFLYCDFMILILCTALKCCAEGTFFNIGQILACPILLCYNGKRGKLRLKYFFYFFYPLHFALLWLISQFLV